MKFKTTKKLMRECNLTILKIGYCGIQRLLNYKNPIAYSCGSIGWHCDYYDIDGICVSTGYNPIGNIVVPYELEKRYDDMALKISCNRELTYTEKETLIDTLLKEFIEEATQCKQ